MKAVKKPVEVEVMQFTQDNKDMVFNWISCSKFPIFDEDNNPLLKIHTLEGDMIAHLGDYIIKGVKGEFYPVKESIFNETYDIVSRMSVETKRIYKIDKDDFYGITQGTRPIIDNKGNVTGHVQNPVATIGYEDRLLVVEPYQVEFAEEQKECVGPNGTDDYNERGISFGEFVKGEETTADKITQYAKGIGNESMICEYTNKGFKELIITWED